MAVIRVISVYLLLIASTYGEETGDEKQLLEMYFKHVCSNQTGNGRNTNTER